MALKGHVFQTLKVPSSLYCLEACTHEPRCQSFDHVMGKDISELNNRTKEARPEDFISDVTKLYFKKPKNRKPEASGKKPKRGKHSRGFRSSVYDIIPGNNTFPSEKSYDYTYLYCSFCVDIDECTSGTHNCHSSLASCTNTAGSFSCTCNSPYRGDGKTCNLPSECQNYGRLNSHTRKITYSGSSSCDRGIGPGWFRFDRSAGTRMATSCPPTYTCNAAATGWLNGGHPTVADGQVSRQVCFHWSGNCCFWSTNIKVRNCGSYYVYYLNGTPGSTCSLRYCGTN
ncbi:unnamed protein product [Porites lobata]|uniref:EGF-like domain-containing protein n=1 Tax=Porites lobata TaxID=104759 RepID=A0ABN8RF37_9CNID|nr:unnamed protein product [Porites lobata]